jgi:hypothetical protein
MTERELTPELAKLLFSPRDLNEPVDEPEPEIEGLPAKDKPTSEWSAEESEAQRASFDRTMREAAKRDERKEREEKQRLEAEANRTDAQRHGDLLSAMAQTGWKAERNRAFLSAVHPEPPPATEGFDGGPRDTAPAPKTAGQVEQEHNQTLLEGLLAAKGRTP